MLNDHINNVKPLYRSREEIALANQSGSGKSTASWFLKGNVRQVMQIPATPGSELAGKVQERLRDFLGLDQGTTKLVERAGKRITTGLIKDDPLPKLGCVYEEPCMVGAGCGLDSSCYEIYCELCAPDPIQPRGDPAQLIAGSRRCRYVGQSGATLHNRQRGLTRTKESVLIKHTQEYHSDRPSPTYQMKPLNSTKTLLHRLVWESQRILDYKNRVPGVLMNSKSEFGGNKMVRFVTQTDRV